MEKLLLILLIGISMFTGCTENINSSKSLKRIEAPLKVENADNIIKVGWKFKEYVKNQKDNLNVESMELPYTDIYLVIKDNENKETLIGTFIGQASEIKKESKDDLPNDLIIACQTWYGGSGEQFCVIKSAQSIIVQSRPIYGASEYAPGEEKDKFKNIKEIKLGKDIRVAPLHANDSSN